MTAEKRRVERAFARMFPLWQRLGVHVVRNHFYEPVPDTRTLDDHLWRSRQEIPGVDLRESAQRSLLEELRRDWAHEYNNFPSAPMGGAALGYYLSNDQFGKVDAEVLYAMVRRLRPRRVIEIGGGYSTTVTAAALQRNRQEDPAASSTLTAIEPYPGRILRAGVPGLDQLIEGPVQSVPLDTFLELGDGDVLFIDSSHMLKIGSDVQYEFLEILPRLRPGVVVQVHDIFLPDEYPRHLVVDWHRFWNEQYLLQAFLTGNRDVEVLFGSYFMHIQHPDELAAAIPSYRREQWPSGLPPSSFWFRRLP